MAQYEQVACGRCGGQRRFNCFGHIQGGVCFQCHGTGKVRRRIYSEAELEAKARRREAVAEKKRQEAVARVQAFLSAKPTASFISSYEGENAFIRDLRAKLEKYGSLSDAQIQAAERSVRAAEETAKKRAGSQFQGTVGERREFKLTIVKDMALETQYGTSYLYIMEDASGNQFKWFASNALSEKVNDGAYEASRRFAKGDAVILNGTVKEHSEYKGARQTVLTRCKLVSSAVATQELVALAA